MKRPTFERRFQPIILHPNASIELNCDRLDRLLFEWAVTTVRFDAVEGLYVVVAFSHFTKNGVVAVQPWSCGGRDEELAAVRSGPRVGHCEQAWLAESEILVALVLKGLSPD